MDEGFALLDLEAGVGEEISDAHWAPRAEVLIHIVGSILPDNRLAWYDEDDATAGLELGKKVFQFVERTRCVLVRIIRDDDVGKIIEQFRGTGNGSDADAVGGLAGGIVDLYPVALAAVDLLQQVPAAAAVVDDDVLGLDVVAELDEVCPASELAEGRMP